MQRVILNNPADTPPANPWFGARRNYHVRTLYALFFTAHTSFEQGVAAWDQNLKSCAAGDALLGSNNSGPLYQLQDLASNLFPQDHQHEQYGQHLNWALQALFQAGLKLQADIKLCRFHHQHQHPDQGDPGHDAFIDGISKEAPKQLKTMALLLDNARDLLQLMLIDQTGNDLLLRLLIEEEALGQTLWGKSTKDLFSAMFPDQPEAGYVQAGKSYFMAQWLEEALGAYEASLALNNELSEPRRQTYVIRAMLKDRQMVKP